jgi:ketosteroid isomerase-like protein
MSQASIEIVRRFYELWNQRDFDAMAALFGTQAVAHTAEGWPEPGPFAGREAIASELRKLQEDFVELTILLEDIARHGDWVLTRHHTLARGERSGVEGEFRNSVAFRLRGGEIVEARFFWEHADALRAAGVEQ